MKVLQNLAVLTAVVFIGACSTAPSADESAFLDAVKGKTATTSDGETAKFSADGREVTLGLSTAVFEKAESALKAQYQNKSANSFKTVITLSEDKKNGTFVINGGTPTTGTFN